eukprot:TRINITY_DN930_c0_g1_i1.p1 TRINITY_DN930_c0_g1~~TRINITY_DN930_c0_g1_i1.p1  ORF type:complete len:361 (+),score=108.29 TRINITY_DN930_c0_g1_i1:89-1171(+)
MDFYDAKRGYVAPFADASWSGPHLNPLDVPTQPWKELEFGLLLLEALVLLHAVQKKQVSLWVGYIAFALIMELVGYSTQALRHGKFTIMATNFLPLEKLLWYSLAFYPVGVAVTRMQPGLGYVGVAALGGALHQLHNFAYDWQGQAHGLRMFLINKDYSWSNFGAEVGEWHGGLCGVFLSHLGMGAAVAIATHYVRKHQLGFFKTVFYLAAAAPASAFVWIPFHCAKRISCLLNDIALDDDLQVGHAQCVRKAPLADSTIWTATLSVFVATALLALCFSPPPMRRIAPAVNLSGRLPAVTVLGYHCLFVHILANHTNADTQVLYTVAGVGVIATFVHFLVWYVCDDEEQHAARRPSVRGG